MQSFVYGRAASLADAVDATTDVDAMVIAGGTELVNWMKDAIVAPRRLVDINGIAGEHISLDERGLTIGALTKMSTVADHPAVRENFPVLSQALLKSASAQIRNMATLGGNVMQRTRCPYFRAEVELPCNKRRAGSGCSAFAGEDRFAAIFGWSEQCIATHPSDAAVALAALEAEIHVDGPHGRRVIPLVDFHRLPGDDPERETVLARGEIITSIVVPAAATAQRSHYLKVRERTSYEFALVSVAACVELQGEVILDARIALGGVAAKPWRLRAAEQALRGEAIVDANALRHAIEIDFGDARPLRHNRFKIELAVRSVVRALQVAGGVE